MSENNDFDKQFDNVCKIIEALGTPGVADAASSAVAGVANVATSTVSGVGNAATSAIGLIDNAIQTLEKIKLQKIENKSKQMEFAHQEKMLNVQNEYELKKQTQQYQHEETMFKQQCEIIKLAIETSASVFKDKLDAYNSQLNRLEQVYLKQSELLDDHIKFLENERREHIDDANRYALISSDLNKLEDQKTELYNTYLKSQGNLEDAIKCLEIEKSFSNTVGGLNGGLIEQR